MIGVAGVAAVTQQDPELLAAVCPDTKDLRPLRADVTLPLTTPAGRPAAVVTRTVFVTCANK
jgi:hypothetical protein